MEGDGVLDGDSVEVAGSMKSEPKGVTAHRRGAPSVAASWVAGRHEENQSNKPVHEVNRTMAQFTRCPECGASVKIENIDRHIARAHPGKRVDFGLSAEEKAAAAKPRRHSGVGRREKLLYPLVSVLVIVAVIVAALAFGGVGNTPDTGFPGERAPDFTLPTAEGEVSLASFANQVVFLDFMDTDCHICQQETPRLLVDLHQAYRDRVVFLSVCVRFIGAADTFGDIEQFRITYGAQWPYALDTEGGAGGIRGEVAQAYGVFGTPTYFVLRPGHWIQDRFGNAPDLSLQDLATSLDSALGG